ncbi:hypothetical protein [Streptomyces jumonjinensis]|uniref:Uncharacterized protein n=1 Tax=Streptomyces jumonjinensis TaxID=1945 RepID=A0A646KLK9_STRJU|nr:hypothetical protein [Streptomyces jumonjinensis]MQT02917.1 hypothetical protein [Streptomyces jumonjinensis]
MSDTNPMEQAAGQAVHTAAVALQVLVMAAQSLREHQQRETAARQSAAPQQPVPPMRKTPPNPDHERYAHIVRGAVHPPAVAEAMVTAPQWPQLADELKKLEAAGIDVKRFVTDAAPVIARMDADLRAGSPSPGVTASQAATTPPNPFAPPPGEEKARKEGPGFIEKAMKWIKEAVTKLIEKITGKAKKAKAADPNRELAAHGISPQENVLHVVTARAALSDEKALHQIVTSREWPGIAAQMKALQQAGHSPGEALAGVPARIRQAAAAGITLTPAEAAHGLLTDMAKITPPTPPQAAPATGSAPSIATAPTTATTTPSTPDRAAAASARSTTATPGATPAPGPTADRGAPTTQPGPTHQHGPSR